MTGLLAATSCQPAAKPRSKNEKYIKQELHKNFIYLSRSLNVEETRGTKHLHKSPEAA